MADSSVLEFRGIVGFLLDGIPHHVAGGWSPSKKLAQRDTATRALAFFVGRWGEQLLELESRSTHLQISRGCTDVQVLEDYCRTQPTCGGRPVCWSCTWEHGMCTALAEIDVLEVPHKFRGVSKPTEDAARVETARRILWYLQCPGYEKKFSADARSDTMAARAIPSPPPNWASDEAEHGALQIAERKTLLMRVQNRLQQEFARQLHSGQSVWEWSYELDEEDTEWPPLCRATVRVPVVGRSFTGRWERGQRDAQSDACRLVSKFLSEVVAQERRQPCEGVVAESRGHLDASGAGDCVDTGKVDHVQL